MFPVAPLMLAFHIIPIMMPIVSIVMSIMVRSIIIMAKFFRIMMPTLVRIMHIMLHIIPLMMPTLVQIMHIPMLNCAQCYDYY